MLWPVAELINNKETGTKVYKAQHPELELWSQGIHARAGDQRLPRAAVAMEDMLDAIVAAQEAGASEEALKPIRELQRKAMWRLDYISSENSKGFHADQEAVRILGESIDYSRQAQAAAYKLGS